VVLGWSFGGWPRARRSRVRAAEGVGLARGWGGMVVVGCGWAGELLKGGEGVRLWRGFLMGVEGGIGGWLVKGG
jgi:hypothetical protein